MGTTGDIIKGKCNGSIRDKARNTGHIVIWLPPIKKRDCTISSGAFSIRTFNPSIVPHTLSRTGCRCWIIPRYSSSFSADGSLIWAKWYPLRALTSILRANCNYFAIGVIVIPKTSCRTIKDPRVRLHPKIRPRQSEGCISLGLPRDRLTFLIMNPSAFTKGVYRLYNGANSDSRWWNDLKSKPVSVIIAWSSPDA